MIYLKSPSEIEIIRSNGAILKECFEIAGKLIRVGVKRVEIDRAIEERILKRGGKPAFKGFHGFPAATCISINEEVVHGIPDDRVLEEGQIVGIDVGVYRDGYYADAARTFPVGEVSPQVKKLLKVTREALEKGIAKAVVGNNLTDISHAVESYVTGHGFSVVKTLVGHGIGQQMHEQPQVPNFGPPAQGPVLEEGLVIAIEPMVNIGGSDVLTLDDGWTVVTADRKLSAHFEDTVAVTKNGPAILTR
ncbi:MAG: type I methionyl aminopeptidase [Candidatus Latescibacteria bacterium]|nr:type I methionyl aminopeptidase [Candidatus Latescibacterota bacterium]NIM20804.1 type I methionyl aminopeptidase [Candidatus Latescibacterota bacterium]NIM64370.1 type I methionyl aminopeptidase [Candidatus Latescibacterota bacterium]NIO00521.1 type I methionyl aminopeptidase [Candidatus Latescibacterota bacterium]NIO26924.1 type I methionyl aminopeptidase [Candidatus Latescibacterota bacterium]